MPQAYIRNRALAVAALSAGVVLGGCGGEAGDEGPAEDATPSPSVEDTRREFEIGSGDPAGELDVIRLEYRSMLGAIQIRGTVQNRSDEVIYIDGYRGYFLGANGSPVAEARICRVSRLLSARDSDDRCNFDDPRLEPGYVSDFLINFRGRPSVARGDTARVVLSYSNP